MRTAALLAACCALLTAFTASAGAAIHNWSRFGFDAARSNSSTAVAGIAAGDIASLKRQDIAVPGTVDSSPIYLHGVTVRGKKRDVFVATTSYGRTFAVGAGKGKILWTFTPAATPGLQGSAQITHSSPVADPNHKFVYAASPDGRIRKLSLANGSEVRSGSWPAVITRDASREKIGTALNLSGSNVIATTGGYIGDAPPYQGHVVVIDRATGKLTRVFNSLCSNRTGIIQPSTCSESGSAVWARSGAVVVPGSKRILFATGDGKWNGSTNWGDSVLVLSPDAKQLVGNWTPTNQGSLDSGDVDLGSTAPALLPLGTRLLALQSGKDAAMRLLDVSNLNGHGHACACKGGELQSLSAPGGNGVYTAPAVLQQSGKTFAFVATFGSTAGYRLDGGGSPKLTRIWIHGTPGTSPIVAGGLLYVYDPPAAA